MQEALTNSLKHSGADVAEVVVAYAPGELRLQVRDHGGDGDRARSARTAAATASSASASGSSSSDGDLAAGPAPGGGFLVRARLPLGGGGS